MLSSIPCCRRLSLLLLPRSSHHHLCAPPSIVALSHSPGPTNSTQIPAWPPPWSFVCHLRLRWHLLLWHSLLRLLAIGTLSIGRSCGRCCYKLSQVGGTSPMRSSIRSRNAGLNGSGRTHLVGLTKWTASLVIDAGAPSRRDEDAVQ